MMRGARHHAGNLVLLHLAALGISRRRKLPGLFIHPRAPKLSPRPIWKVAKVRVARVIQFGSVTSVQKARVTKKSH